MLRQLTERPRHVLMTIDAVGGVWRYAMDLGAALAAQGVAMLFVGLGPKPSPLQRAEAEHIGRLAWLEWPLDWLAEGPGALDGLAQALGGLVSANGIDLVHLNLPTQAAGLDVRCPVVVVSHSCVVTWFGAVRGTDLPPEWSWQRDLNGRGLKQADAVFVPSRSHGAALEASYGPLDRLVVIPNATTPSRGSRGKEAVVLAAGRWWDEGKNGSTLDAAAGWINWPVLMAGATSGPNGQALTLANARQLGEVPAAALRTRLGRAAIVASPSLYEPFGLVALEAASAGAALVLADIPTYRELWSGAAEFVPPRDVGAWVETINRLAQSPQERERLGSAALQRARRFSLAAQRDAVLDAYGAALAAAPQSVMVA
jgi:glycosyltransferase involved in cell wall biosynthesis